MYFLLKLVVNFIMKYVFINIFLIQREKCENSNALFIFIETYVFIATIHNSI